MLNTYLKYQDFIKLYNSCPNSVKNVFPELSGSLGPGTTNENGWYRKPFQRLWLAGSGMWPAQHSEAQTADCRPWLNLSHCLSILLTTSGRELSKRKMYPCKCVRGWASVLTRQLTLSDSKSIILFFSTQRWSWRVGFTPMAWKC